MYYEKATKSYVYSPSDLAIFLHSPFSSWVARLKLDNPDGFNDIKKDYDPILELLGQQGFSHESDYLKKLKEQYGENNVKEISNNKETAAAETIKAMQDGVDVIFQAYLQRDNFVGYADFLVRRDDGESKFGTYYYEAWDTKRSKSVKPYFLIQLCCYSWMLEEMQSKLPEEVVIVLGNQKEERIRIAAYYSYFLNFKQQLLNIQEILKVIMCQILL
jgi:predicted RecB family nuclease